MKRMAQGQNDCAGRQCDRTGRCRQCAKQHPWGRNARRDPDRQDCSRGRREPRLPRNRVHRRGAQAPVEGRSQCRAALAPAWGERHRSSAVNLRRASVMSSTAQMYLGDPGKRCNRMRCSGYHRVAGALARKCSRAEATKGATATISSWAAKTSSPSSEITDPTSRADIGLASDTGTLVGRAAAGRIAFCLLSFAGWNRRTGRG